MTADDRSREAVRQQMLLRVLLGDARPGAADGWLRGTPAQRQRGLQAHRAHAGALAERALATAFPTVQQLMGDASFAALARALWQAHPPQQGDVATWGDDLPAFVAASEQLADEPYLADVARLDWAVHLADRAADDEGPPEGLSELAGPDPQALRLRLRAGHAVLRSAYPLHTLWQAHRHEGPDRFAPVRLAFAAGRAESVRVRREGLRSVAEPIDALTAAFEARLLQGATLGEALAATDDGFGFEPWLMDTLQRGSLAAVLRLSEPLA